MLDLIDRIWGYAKTIPIQIVESDGIMSQVNLFHHSDEVVSFPTGHVLFRQGQEGDVMYVVKEGQIDILLGSRLVETVGAGGIVGEMALLDDTVRTATAVVRSACKVVPITKRRLLFMLDETPQFALQIMQIMAERLRYMDDEYLNASV